MPLAGRRLAVPLEVDGLSLPAGTDVTPSMWLTHTRPEEYPEPYAFRPERFLENPPSTYTWIPFGGGVRRCIGAPFAELEMRVVLEEVLERFDLRAAGPRRRGHRAPQRHVLTPPRHPHRRHAALTEYCRRVISGRKQLSAREPFRGRVVVPSRSPRRRRAAARADRLSARGQPSRRGAAGRAAPPRAVLRDGRRRRRPGDATGVRRFQARRGLSADGVVGPRTRRAFGTLGRHPIGSRPLRSGHRGWDVAALQFALGVKGFPCGPVDGGFGARTDAAVQRAAGGTPGCPRTASPGPRRWRCFAGRPRPRRRCRRPIDAPLGDRYGPRGNGFHAGLDFPAPSGTTVRAAAPGRVTFAGFASGWGLVVTVDHGGWKTRYAHLSRATVSPGESVAAGERVGLVGATGLATGPHLHFEVVVRGANVNPAGGL